MNTTELQELLNGPDRFKLVLSVLTRNLRKDPVNLTELASVPQEALDIVEHIIKTYAAETDQYNTEVKYIVYFDDVGYFHPSWNLRDLKCIEDICSDKEMRFESKQACLVSIFDYVEKIMEHMGFYAWAFNEYIDDYDYGIGLSIEVR